MTQVQFPTPTQCKRRATICPLTYTCVSWHVCACTLTHTINTCHICTIDTCILKIHHGPMQKQKNLWDSPSRQSANTTPNLWNHKGKLDKLDLIKITTPVLLKILWGSEKTSHGLSENYLCVTKDKDGHLDHRVLKMQQQKPNKKKKTRYAKSVRKWAKGMDVTHEGIQTANQHTGRCLASSATFSC